MKTKSIPTFEEGVFQYFTFKKEKK